MNLDNFLVRPHRQWVEQYAELGRLDDTCPPRTPARSPEHLAGLPVERHATTTRTPSGSTCSSCAASSPNSRATPSPPNGSASRSRTSPPRCSARPRSRRSQAQQAAAGRGRRRRVVGRRHPADAGGGPATGPRPGAVRGEDQAASRSTPTSRTSSARPPSSSCPASRRHELGAVPRQGRAPTSSEHEDHLALQRLRRNKQLTPEDLRGAGADAGRRPAPAPRTTSPGPRRSRTASDCSSAPWSAWTARPRPRRSTAT